MKKLFDRFTCNFYAYGAASFRLNVEIFVFLALFEIGSNAGRPESSEWMNDVTFCIQFLQRFLSHVHLVAGCALVKFA